MLTARVRRVLAVGLMVSAPAFAAGTQPAMIKLPVAAAEALQVWVGHWHTRGESGGTPWHAETRCTWSMNHGFVVCDQLINDRLNQLMILTYDASAKAYRITSVGKDRPPIIAFGTVKNGVWTNIAKLEQGRKSILMKTTVDFSVPRHYTDREMVSEDGGAHWSETSRGHSTQSD